MKQYRISADSFRQSNPDIPDAYMDPAEINNLQRLAGIDTSTPAPDFAEGSNISKTAMEKVNLMKSNNIKPGTQEWFRLWFSLPYLTGEKPVSK